MNFTKWHQTRCCCQNNIIKINAFWKLLDDVKTGDIPFNKAPLANCKIPFLSDHSSNNPRFISWPKKPHDTWWWQMTLAAPNGVRPPLPRLPPLTNPIAPSPTPEPLAASCCTRRWRSSPISPHCEMTSFHFLSIIFIVLEE